jgi:hypothetical protein
MYASFWSRVPSEKLGVALLVWENLCEVVTLVTIPRQLSVVQTSHYYMLITSVIQLHFYLGRGLPDGLFPFVFPTKYIYFSFFPCYMYDIAFCNLMRLSVMLLFFGRDDAESVGNAASNGPIVPAPNNR